MLFVACQTDRTDERRQPNALEPQLSGTVPKRMRNCPSAVSTANTIATPTADGVDVTITSNDPVARRKIIDLTRLHATFAEPIWGMPPHTGMHGGPGTLGFCPILHVKTIVTHTERSDGVRIHVRAIDPSMVSRLQEVTTLRVHAFAPPSS